LRLKEVLVSQADVLEEALHVYLKKRGLDDGLLFDRQEVIDSLPEMSELW